jgi:hypothetical protein
MAASFQPLRITVTSAEDKKMHVEECDSVLKLHFCTLTMRFALIIGRKGMSVAFQFGGKRRSLWNESFGSSVHMFTTVPGSTERITKL